MQVFIILTLLLSYLPLLKATGTITKGLQPDPTLVVQEPQDTGDLYGHPYSVARVQSVVKTAYSDYSICLYWIEVMSNVIAVRFTRMEWESYSNPYSLSRGDGWLNQLAALASRARVMFSRRVRTIEELRQRQPMMDAATKAIAYAKSGDSQAARLEVKVCLEKREIVRNAAWGFTSDFWKVRSIVGAMYQGEFSADYLSFLAQTRADRRWDEPAQRASIEQTLSEMALGPDVERTDIPPWRRNWPRVGEMWRAFMDSWLQRSGLSMDNDDDIDEITAIRNIASKDRNPWEWSPPPFVYPRRPEPDSRSWPSTAEYNYDGSAR